MFPYTSFIPKNIVNYSFKKSLEQFPYFRNHKATSESTIAATAAATATAAAATAVAAAAVAAATCAASALENFKTYKKITLGDTNRLKKKTNADDHLFVVPPRHFQRGSF